MPAAKPARKFDAVPDTLDFRDTMYIPTLVEVMPTSDLAAYRGLSVPVLDQGREGACTGFGLATVANYLRLMLGLQPSVDRVSARMLYIMARRYDEWEGEAYEGSSARGAMKGWHKHGVCGAALWKDNDLKADLDTARAADALKRPLGAYFRVNHRDLVAMHSAISEVGVLYGTARVHQGWMDVKPGDQNIVFKEGTVGGHAFAIVGYDTDGIWIQNSWGPDWGSGGLARVSYDDWLANGTDVWVARLGAPVHLLQPSAAALMRSGAPRSYESYIYASLRPHIVTADNDGILRGKGVYGLTPEGVKEIVRTVLPGKVAAWKKKRVVIYGHGGLHAEASAVQYVANWRDEALSAEVYPISVIWRSDALNTIRNILSEAMGRRRDEGVLDAAKDFMLDRLDDTLEPLARLLDGKALWDEMKENADGCTSKKGGAARLLAGHLVDALKAGEIDEIHLAGHSAGAVLHAQLARYLVSLGVKIKSVSLWAPACTLELFDQVYRPLIESGDIEAFDIYTLDDATERDDDCAQIYHKSLLYLVSAALEKRPRNILTGFDGEPLLGLARDVGRHIPKSFWVKSRNWYLAPGSTHSNARHHGDFDNDPETLTSTLERITGKAAPPAAPSATPPLKAPTSLATRERRRQQLNVALALPPGSRRFP